MCSVVRDDPIHYTFCKSYLLSIFAQSRRRSPPLPPEHRYASKWDSPLCKRTLSAPASAASQQSCHENP